MKNNNSVFVFFSRYRKWNFILVENEERNYKFVCAIFATSKVIVDKSLGRLASFVLKHNFHFSKSLLNFYPTQRFHFIFFCIARNFALNWKNAKCFWHVYQYKEKGENRK